MKTETRKKILIAIFVITLAVVWGQSFISKSTSEAASDYIVDKIQPLEEIKPDPTAEVPTVEYDFLNHLVRKGAHVFEYMVIGIELMLIFVVCCIKAQPKNEPTRGMAVQIKQHGQYLLYCVFIGMFIGLVDETIQIFSERGSQIKDIWFDILGMAIGALVVGMINIIRIKRKK